MAMEQKIQRAEHTRQLAFDYEEAGGAQPEHSRGTQTTTPSSGTGALAQSLMEAVVESRNMRRAWEQVKRNKGSAGVDGRSIAETGAHLKEHWRTLRSQLLEGRYHPQAIRRVAIPKPDGGVRQLGIPTVLDRLIQQALLQVFTPLYDPTFSESSYGFRPKRSAHQAVRAARDYVLDGKGWVVDLDLEKFFDRVNHDVLMGRLRHRIGDKRLLKLLRGYLTAGALCNGVVTDREEGTPQGGPGV